MVRREVFQAGRPCAAHALLFVFTIVMVLKLHYHFSYSWWVVFTPLWIFHGVVARGIFSIPTPRDPDISPTRFHVVVATPLLIAFELLLCVYLQSSYVSEVVDVNLNIVFLPLYLLGTIIIIDNLRIASVLCPETKKQISIHKESSAQLLERAGEDFRQKNDDYYSAMAAISIPFFLGGTMLKIHFTVGAKYLDVWLPYFYLFGSGQYFVYASWLGDTLLYPYPREKDGYFNRNRSFESDLDDKNKSLLSLQNIGFHVMMVFVVGFQVLLCTHLEAVGREFPVPIIFSPLFVLQGIGVVFYTTQLVKTISTNGLYATTVSSRAHDFLECMRHGIRFLGWWSIDEGRREEQARHLHDCEFRYNTFCGSPPDVVKKMTKKDLVKEVFSLQEAMNEHIQLTKSSLREYKEYEHLRYEKALCGVCFGKKIV